MRSAPSLSATTPRAIDMPGEIAPPRTMMPSGAPRDTSQGGKRCSSGRIRILPSGENPTKAISTRLVTMSQLARRRNRVHNSASPISPMKIRTFDGSAKKPRVLDRVKNIRVVFLPRYVSRVLRPALPPRGVARLGVVVRRIESGQLHAFFDFAEDPALVKLVLGALVGGELR